MIAATEERVVWHPVAEEEKTAVRSALADVLANPHFCNSKRYPAFLSYVVEALLTGHAYELKERTLGIEVFGRRQDYDTNSDTIVRYTAGEVRKRLALYYSETYPAPIIRIHLPIGSYVPELLLAVQAESGETLVPAHASNSPPPGLIEAGVSPESVSVSDSVELQPHLEIPDHAAAPVTTPVEVHTTQKRWRALGFQALAVLLVLVLAMAVFLHRRAGVGAKDGALNAFWAPTLNASGTTLICSGSVVFAPNSFSGVTTAPRDTDYSFVSIQIAESIAHLSGYLDRHNAAYTLQTSASTSLTDLRDRPIILLGGYNNLWSVRLLEPLRFHFSPNLNSPAIVDAQQPTRTWARDKSQSYGSADDYAIVARFTDSMSDSPVVVLAGLGRNGTEAATQFAITPKLLAEYMEEHPLPSKGNVEFVLHSRVVEGRTGAPSIVASFAW